MHTLDQYRGTIAVCRYLPPPHLTRWESQSILQARFSNALAKVVLAQPHLQVGIVGEGSRTPTFVCVDHLDLRNHVEWITAQDAAELERVYSETLQTQLDAKFENLATQPGWRVVVVQEKDSESMEVLYVWNHAHHDGSGGKIFHRHLLRHLNETTSEEDIEPIIEHLKDQKKWILDVSHSSKKFPPNPELLSSWPMSPVFAVREVWKSVKPQRFFPPGPMHAHWAPNQLTPYKTSYRNFTMDSQDVTKIVAACRLLQTTLTGLIQALCLVSLSNSLKDMRGFASRTPYDLRNILPPNPKAYPWLVPKETICNYVSVLEHEFDTKLVDAIRSHMPAMSSESKMPAELMDIVWSVAARLRREIKARLDNGTYNDLIGIMKLCPNWITQQKDEMRRMRYLSWLVTNLGVFDGEPGAGNGTDGKWSLRRAELILSAETPSAALSVSIMTVKDREMVLTCSWQECVVDADLVEGLMGDLKRWLRDISAD